MWKKNQHHVHEGVLISSNKCVSWQAAAGQQTGRQTGQGKNYLLGSIVVVLKAVFSEIRSQDMSSSRFLPKTKPLIGRSANQVSGFWRETA